MKGFTVEQYRQVLRRVEWQARVWYLSGFVPACPCCDAPQPEGHEPACMLHRALIQGTCDSCEGQPMRDAEIPNGEYTEDVPGTCPDCQVNAEEFA